jgi:hypothetical protein
VGGSTVVPFEFLNFVIEHGFIPGPTVFNFVLVTQNKPSGNGKTPAWERDRSINSFHFLLGIKWPGAAVRRLPVVKASAGAHHSCQRRPCQYPRPSCSRHT